MLWIAKKKNNVNICWNDFYLFCILQNFAFVKPNDAKPNKHLAQLWRIYRSLYSQAYDAIQTLENSTNKGKSPLSMKLASVTVLWHAPAEVQVRKSHCCVCLLICIILGGNDKKNLF